jgi:hypothetical protein
VTAQALDRCQVRSSAAAARSVSLHAVEINADVAAHLRDHFILHWKSVRPVPVVTIDFGDGRVVRRTITGNSIHYVLTPDGQVIDGIPGLYDPKAFLKILAADENAFAQVDPSMARRPYRRLSSCGRQRVQQARLRRTVFDAGFRSLARTSSGRHVFGLGRRWRVSVSR